MTDPCTHLDDARDVTPSGDGCEDWWRCDVEEAVLTVPGTASPEHP